MTIEYAKAYRRERMELAQRKRQQAEAVTGEVRPPRPVRYAFGRSLIALGERLTAQPLGDAVRSG